MRFIKAYEKKEAFLNLATLYAYEASISIPELGKDIDENGKLEIPGVRRFLEEDSEAYVIMEGAKAIGIVGFTKVNETTWMMDEIFVTKTFRTQEVMDGLLDFFLKEKQCTFKTHILKCQKDVCLQFENHFPTVNKTELDPIAWKYSVEITKAC